MKKFISIIIPFKNSNSTIKRCLNSILKQKGNINYEVILIDDYSSDKTSKTIKKIIHDKKNFILINSKTKTIGPGYARNIGIKKSNSKYLFFLDSDDFLENDALINLKKIVGNKKIDLVCCNYKIQDSIGNFKKKSRFDLKLYSSSKLRIIKNFFELSIVPQVISNLISKNLVLKNNIKFSNGYFEDIFFYFKILFFFEKKIILKKKIYIKNNRYNSIVNSLSAKHIKDSFMSYYKCYLFAKKRKKKFVNINLEKLLLFTFVGQVAVFVKRIEKLKNNSNLKEFLYKNLKSIYFRHKKGLKINYRFKTNKDVIAKKFLYN